MPRLHRQLPAAADCTLFTAVMMLAIEHVVLVLLTRWMALRVSRMVFWSGAGVRVQWTSG